MLEKRYAEEDDGEDGKARRELKVLGQIFLFFFFILICPALSKCQTALGAGRNSLL